MAGAVQWIAESVHEILQAPGLTLQTFVIFCLAFLLTCTLLRRSQNLPPYPAGRVPVLGHLLALGRAPHLKLTAWRRQYGDVFTVRMGMEDVVVLNGYTAVKDALVDRSELFASRPRIYMLDSIAGDGKDMVAARWGPGFRQRKRFATIALKNLGMKVGRGSIEDNIREEANCLRSRVAEYEGQPFDFAHDVTVTVANVICSMVFGKRYDYEDETFQELSKAVTAVVTELAAGQIISVFPALRFVPGVNRAGTDLLQHVSKIHQVMWEEISRRREHLHRENPRDFLDFCLLEIDQQDKVEGLTEENVMYMAMNLFLAGTETTGNTLLWALLYLTQNPAIQHKVHEELDAVVGASLPTLSHRSRLPYVNACLLETMRIRTLVPLAIPHSTTQDVKVQKFDIPKGTQRVELEVGGAQSDEAEKAEVVKQTAVEEGGRPPALHEVGRQDKQLLEKIKEAVHIQLEGAKLNRNDGWELYMSYLPLLRKEVGRRVCLGEQLARMELFLFFSCLLQSFTFNTPEGAPPPNTDGILGITWTPNPYQLCATPR
ncbi:cytochrome P450 2D4-like [Branchiostoma floridae]|uniref:Cytochrome P450 2D4-like n=1 Tax=Branchiostoma floridae TaxID=7739 RepID=A0A9J7MT53_BRAFL|nr:cytochrome P450 2D4-like [Branchiostoma floridae]